MINFICDDTSISKILKENVKTIQEFFKINLNLDVTIKTLDFTNFKNEYENYIKNSISPYTVGFIESSKNTIVYLKYDEWNKTAHINKDIEHFNKVIIHELVHLIHANYCNRNYPSKEIWEGIACYLANQNDVDYYYFFKRIIDSNSHEKVLEILKNNIKQVDCD